MLSTTQGIILKKIPYSDQKYILKVFTRDFGLASFAISINKKNTSIRSIIGQPLSLVEIEYYSNSGTDIKRIKNLNLHHNFQEISYNIDKQCVSLFMNELILQCLRLPQDDKQVYYFIIDSLQGLDNLKSSIANFPIFFAIELAKILGFGPKHSDNEEETLFDLQSGRFISESIIPSITMDKECSFYYNKLLTSTKPLEIKIPKKVRIIMLSFIMEYYSFHGDFNPELHSFEILRTILE